MNLGAKVVKHRHIIFIVSLLLLIPSLIGYRVTRINYDMLTYLPSTMDTMKGQNVLMKEFGKGGFSIVVLENMKSDDVTQLKADYSRINGVEEVKSRRCARSNSSEVYATRPGGAEFIK